MTLQAIRRYYEEAVEAAATAEGIDIRYSNELDAGGDAASEFLTVRVSFGLFTESTTCGAIENIRGTIIVDYFGPKGRGPGRAQTVMTEITKQLCLLTARPKQRVNGVLGTINDLTGPAFAALSDRPYFFASLSGGIVASYQ